MPGTFQTLSITSQALQAFQQALEVTGNNISNANTVGYSRQTVSYGQNQESPYFTIGGEQFVGNGVNIASIDRMRDQFLQAQSLSSATNLGSINTQVSGGQQIQTLFNDTNGTGIGNDLSVFYNSWSALAAQPNSANLLAVQRAGISLTTDVRNTYASLQQIQGQAASATNQTISQIQSLANQIDTLNKQITAATAGGGTPNTLLDQRDQAVQQLAGLVNISTHPQPNGSVIINVNQFDLVDSGSAHTFPTTYDATTGTVSDANGTYTITGGQLYGNFSQANNATGVMGQLDKFANALRTQVNSIMSTGMTGNGTIGQNFFNDSNPQTGAIDFNLDPAVLADPNNIATGTTGNAGDTALALEIANSATVPVASLGNASTTNFYSGVVSGVGASVADATSTQGTLQAVDTQIQSQIQSVSGVSLDEEMSNMLKFQQSYQAAAKALTIANSVMDDLLNMVQ